MQRPAEGFSTPWVLARCWEAEACSPRHGAGQACQGPGAEICRHARSPSYLELWQCGGMIFQLPPAPSLTRLGRRGCPMACLQRGDTAPSFSHPQARSIGRFSISADAPRLSPSQQRHNFHSSLFGNLARENCHSLTALLHPTRARAVLDRVCLPRQGGRNPDPIASGINTQVSLASFAKCHLSAFIELAETHLGTDKSKHRVILCKPLILSFEISIVSSASSLQRCPENSL